MSAVFEILPRLHSLLALMLVKAQNPQLSDTQLVRLSRTIVRLTRLIIKEQTAAMQHRLKTAMLADPQWRARVIWELGGVEALEIWRQRFWFKRKSAQRAGEARGKGGAFDCQTSAAGNDAQKAESAFQKADEKPTYQFRLKQPERPFYGRKPADKNVHTDCEPKPTVSPLDRPIPLMPYDFWPLQLETKSATKSAVPNAEHYEAGLDDDGKPDKGKKPPPKPEPP